MMAEGTRSKSLDEGLKQVQESNRQLRQDVDSISTCMEDQKKLGSQVRHAGPQQKSTSLSQLSTIEEYSIHLKADEETFT
ncbi:hypothetical protein L1987_20164 [Smallanthus sonchifolius]|uniref:Uncharacterized protein n=1 Tax=Smallanthus sonchifolius TaxID=185202 RepID=A0ACB9IRV6_9ASTR|nr:hypothetical protein L1987_20164 [Smallanthus sonchifolius]